MTLRLPLVSPSSSQAEAATCIAVSEYEINGYWVTEAAGQTSLNKPGLSRANEGCIIFHYGIAPIILTGNSGSKATGEWEAPQS